MGTEYAELHVQSYYSFLDGASSPRELAFAAKAAGCKAIALTDLHGFFGISEFVKAAKEAGIQPIVGARFALEGSFITLLSKNAEGYKALSVLITRANKQLSPALLQATDLSNIIGFCADMDVATRCAAHFPAGSFYLELINHFEEGQAEANKKRARSCKLPLLATNAVRYASVQKAALYDVLLCIAKGKTLEDAFDELPANQQRCLKGPEQMQAAFSDLQQALANTVKVASECSCDIDFSAYAFPKFTDDGSEEAMLRERALLALHQKYRVSDPILPRLEHELGLIASLNLSGYFLIVADICDYAKSERIACQGRGSAANSLVAYLLGITAVDPVAHNLFLGRFIHEGMRTIPDIDLDFGTTNDSAQKERKHVIDYVYRRYGADHVAMVCTFITFQRRLAVREVGKVLGLPESILRRIGKNYSEIEPYLDLPEWRLFADRVEEIIDLPRHMSIHVGGMLITSCKVSELVPLQVSNTDNRLIVQWDKDGVDDAGLVKIDVLGLRTLGCLSEMAQRLGLASWTDVPAEDPLVYDMMAKADTIGLFQIESRAQMQTLPRVRPQNLSELAIEIALVRPGPIQGDMVQPYIKRRMGLEPVSPLHPRLAPVLQETLGIILYQEQVLQVAVAVASLTSSEAEELRRAMSRKRSKEMMARLKNIYLSGALRNGYSEDSALRIFSCLEGFALYGFCKSHALSFALITYATAWFKRHHPAVFFAALLNNQPMGFYSAQTLIQAAKQAGVQILPICINTSKWSCVSHESSIRLGFNQVIGLKESESLVLIQNQPFTSLRDCILRAKLSARSLEKLILAGAFSSFGLTERENLWQLYVFIPPDLIEDRSKVPILPAYSLSQQLEARLRSVGYSVATHPMQLLRAQLAGEATARSVRGAADGLPITISGLVICRQRPPTAKGFCFLSLEDEFGISNIIIPPDVYEDYKSVFRLAPFIRVEGLVQSFRQIVNVKARTLTYL